jgi:hypothetical protein
MTCAAEIRRRYDTRSEAWEYLTSRGFTCRTEGGWVNGRWAALVQPDEHGVDVTVWLRLQMATSLYRGTGQLKADHGGCSAR